MKGQNLLYQILLILYGFYRYEKTPAGLKNDKSHILIWNGEDFENAPH